ncbi:MAG: leucine-rich repeat protein [Muribaculaceae bacterium]|nr:leucine-rich repeat protein [Muribaculaceae bacterium]
MKKILLTLALLASATMAWAVQVECSPGNLKNLVDDTSVTTLVVTGQMDARDFKFISDELDALTSVDLSGVTIVGYSTVEPLINNEASFGADCIPPLSFAGKNSLAQVTLPSNTRGIGMAAFAGCSRLASFTFPESLDSIADYAFAATKLNQVTLPQGVQHLGEGAFSNNTNLTSVTIVPEGKLELPARAFEGCTRLVTVMLGTNVTAMGDRAFMGTTSLTSVSIEGSNNIKQLGDRAFLGSGITSFDFENALRLRSVGDWAFAQSKLASVATALGTNHLGKGAFYYAPSLTSYVPNRQCDSIAPMFLAGTQVENNVTYNTAIRYIGDYAFYNTPVQTLILPNSLQYIGTRAMAGMTHLGSLTCYALDVPQLGDEVWAGIDQSTIPLMVVEGCVEKYSGAAQWMGFMIQDFLFGDVNRDGYVNATDITIIYNILLGAAYEFMETANVNGDAVISSTDITIIYNILLGIAYAPGRGKSVSDSSDQMSAEDFVIEAGETHVMEVELVNDAGFSAMQLDIEMPQGLSISDVTTTDRAKDMIMGFNEIEPGKWRIVMHSAEAMEGNEGTLLNITVKADETFGGNETITVSNIQGVEPSELTHYIDDFTVEVGTTTGVKDINIDSQSTGPVDVYNMNGQLLRQGVERSQATQGLPQGLYIVGGKKVIVR